MEVINTEYVKEVFLSELDLHIKIIHTRFRKFNQTIWT